MNVLGAPWWQAGVIYEVYPRSFMDGNGDGVGDLPGLIGRLDYLVELGVDAVWVAPIFPSPMADFGYDVADYCGVDPQFGTLDDFDRLVASAHERGLKLILDFVPNHTSVAHPWFEESRASRASARRDWYIWHDPAPDGGPPNNWLAQFGGSAWEWDVATGQYYLHSFLKEQPDLNWRTGAVRSAMYAALRFWLDRGVDGFRIDVLWMLIKDAQFRDNPPNPAYVPARGSYDALLQTYTADRPEVHAIVAEMRAVLDSYADRVMIGEIYLPVPRLMAYYGADLGGAQLPFNFQLIDAPWNAASLAEIISSYEAALPPGAWPNWVIGNHDKPRIASRIGNARARLAAMLLLTLRGTPTMYYGDELGMTDVAIPTQSVRDPAEINQPGIGLGRDPQRTPMPWTPAPLAGFTTGEPWLPLGDHHQLNVATESAAERSMLALYRRLLAIRRSYAALTGGSLEAVAAQGDVLTFERGDAQNRLTVALNFGADSRTISAHAGRVIISTMLDRDPENVGDTLTLRSAEGVVIMHV